MKKLKNNAGFTLIEILCALLIMVLLVIGMGVGMGSGTQIYREAAFESESGTLAGIVNTSLGDILRYSINIRPVTAAEKLEHGADVGIPDADDATKRYVFTSMDYGIQDAYFYLPPHESGKTMGTLHMKNLRNAVARELVNSGAYPDLLISEFAITFTPRTGVGAAGGYFTITYKIVSDSDNTKTRQVETIVRVMN
jgi:prepilin-type N-terminal cleavage/methylation domain-containing protein